MGQLNMYGDIRTLTTPEEKSRRFDFINDKFMEKYLDLVWFARANPEKLLKDERYEILKTIQDMEKKYPKETEELYEDETSWQHGFNSGILAYARFLATYVEDTLCALEHMDGEVEESEIVVVKGEKCIVMDGKADAEENFPELYT